MLMYMLGRLTVGQSHWISRKLGIFDGMHDWLHGFCPCLDDDE